MDSQDQRKSIPSGRESHGVYLCHKCGWPFPNPHPSAKQRRAHKRICGTVEGYKMIDSEEQINLAVSDDEHGSDEDRQTPSTKIVKHSTKEISSGGVSARSNRSEDEVFSDAVTEFSDNGFSPVNEEQLKADATSGIQISNSPTDSNQMHNNTVLEYETNLLGGAIPIEDSVSTCNSDPVVDIRKEDEKVIVGENEMQSSSIFLEQGNDVKGNEESNVDEILSDVAVAPCKTANEASEVACELQEKDPKTSDSLSVNQIVKPKEETFGSTMCRHDLSPEVKSCDHVEVAAQIESYSAKDGDIGSHSDAVDACDKEGKGNENVHVLLVANDLPAVDNPEIMIQDFKDHKTWKSNLLVTVESGEVIEPAVDDNNDTVCEEKSSIFPSVKSRASFDIPSAELQVLEGNLKQEDEDKRVLAAEVPVEKEVDTSELKVGSKDIGSYGVEATPETTVIQKIQIDIEEQRPHDYHTDQLQNIKVEPSAIGLSDVISVNISAADEVIHETNLCGGKNEYNIDKDKNEKCDTDGKQSRELVKEELSTNVETTSVSVDDLSVSKADQTMDDLGTGNSGDHKKTGIEVSDLVGNGNKDVAVQDRPEMNSKMNIESASTPSDTKIVVGEMDKCTNNLQEAESTTYFVHDSSEVGPDASHLRITAPARSDLQNREGEDSEEAMKEPKSNCMNIVLAENVDAVCKGVESNHDSGAEVSERTAETPPEPFPVESDSTMKRSSTVADDSHCRDGGLGSSGVSTENLQWEGHENLTRPPIEVPAVDVSVDSSSQSKKLAKPPIEVPSVDVSVDSSSQPDSLEGNWGSVSVLSTQSDAVAAVDAEALPSTVPEAPAELDKLNLQKPQATLGGHHSSKSDVFEPPSFMTLVEHQDRGDQKAAAADIQTVENTEQQKSEALRAGWFPSLTNIVNESQGRKKNEEIIAKVTNWSTGKQHTPLKSLLGEANLETKPKSPNPKQNPSVTKQDENTATVNSILGSEAPTDQVAKREMGKEWNSPARYPSGNKKEKKVKGKPYWVPFLCCSSMN
ncbi:GPI-anchored adhesin-like protein precursor [Actinidia chinensis var. chinensis]|uniref:GPI-anchored adhesin-like protein n=1 Tax=Actinidia chinensis var. chinensis TaxID=1590841 RepID=A0A2R6R8P6_ACTCC|nr:GPI-anchored adhesin-like protein precursor [Actinidia chinensis var. chinensis]